MTRKRWKLRIVAIICVPIVAGCGWLIFQALNAGREGENQLERWIGQQLQTIANSYLEPRLSFDSLDYIYPMTVRLGGLKLSAPDPMRPGYDLNIISVDGAELQLAQIPRVGQPIVIERIVLLRPVIRAVAEEGASPRLIGFSQILARTADEAPRPAPTTAAGAGEPVAVLSDYFQIRLIQIVEGRLLYDPRIADTKPMLLDRINAQMDVTAGEAGWYTLKLGVHRAQILDMTASAAVSLDNFDMRDILIEMSADVGREKDQFLPPELQELLRKYNVTGSMTARVQGTAMIRDWTRSELALHAKFTGAGMTIGEYRMLIDSMELNAFFENAGIAVPIWTIQALQGSAAISAFVSLDEKLNGELRLRARDMRLQELLRESTGQNLKFVGRLNADVDMKAPFATVLAKATPAEMRPESGSVRERMDALLGQRLPDKWGNLSLRIDQARLGRVPVLSTFVSVLGSVFGLVTGRGDIDRSNDQLEIAGEFQGDELRISSATLNTDSIAARVTGSMTLDRKLDLTGSGGPIQKIGQLLGPAEALVSGAGKFLMQLRIRGTLEKPEVSVMPGGGVRDVASGVGRGAQQVGDAVLDGAGRVLDGIFGGPKRSTTPSTQPANPQQ